MNKSELTDFVAESTGLNKGQSAQAIDAVIEGISQALKNSEQLLLVGFGTFLVKERSARKGRNPKTGESIDIAASRVPAFKPGKALKDLLNN